MNNQNLGLGRLQRSILEAARSSGSAGFLLNDLLPGGYTESQYQCLRRAARTLAGIRPRRIITFEGGIVRLRERETPVERSPGFRSESSRETVTLWCP